MTTSSPLGRGLFHLDGPLLLQAHHFSIPPTPFLEAQTLVAAPLGGSLPPLEIELYPLSFLLALVSPGHNKMSTTSPFPRNNIDNICLSPVLRPLASRPSNGRSLEKEAPMTMDCRCPLPVAKFLLLRSLNNNKCKRQRARVGRNFKKTLRWRPLRLNALFRRSGGRIVGSPGAVIRETSSSQRTENFRSSHLLDALESCRDLCRASHPFVFGGRRLKIKASLELKATKLT